MRILGILTVFEICSNFDEFSEKTSDFLDMPKMWLLPKKLRRQRKNLNIMTLKTFLFEKKSGNRYLL